MRWSLVLWVGLVALAAVAWLAWFGKADAPEPGRPRSERRAERVEDGGLYDFDVATGPECRASRHGRVVSQALDLLEAVEDAEEADPTGVLQSGTTLVAPRAVLQRAVLSEWTDGTRVGSALTERGPAGLRFANVPRGSEAAALGFRVNDVLVFVDEHGLGDFADNRRVWDLVARDPVVCFRVWRQGSFQAWYVAVLEALREPGVDAAAGQEG